MSHLHRVDATDRTRLPSIAHSGQPRPATATAHRVVVSSLQQVSTAKSSQHIVVRGKFPVVVKNSESTPVMTRLYLDPISKRGLVQVCREVSAGKSTMVASNKNVSFLSSSDLEIGSVSVFSVEGLGPIAILNDVKVDVTYQELAEALNDLHKQGVQAVSGNMQIADFNREGLSAFVDQRFPVHVVQLKVALSLSPSKKENVVLNPSLIGPDCSRSDSNAIILLTDELTCEARDAFSRHNPVLFYDDVPVSPSELKEDPMRGFSDDPNESQGTTAPGIELRRGAEIVRVSFLDTAVSVERDDSFFGYQDAQLAVAYPLIESADGTVDNNAFRALKRAALSFSSAFSEAFARFVYDPEALRSNRASYDDLLVNTTALRAQLDLPASESLDWGHLLINTDRGEMPSIVSALNDVGKPALPDRARYSVFGLLSSLHSVVQQFISQAKPSPRKAEELTRLFPSSNRRDCGQKMSQDPLFRDFVESLTRDLSGDSVRFDTFVTRILSRFSLECPFQSEEESPKTTNEKRRDIFARLSMMTKPDSGLAPFNGTSVLCVSRAPNHLRVSRPIRVAEERHRLLSASKTMRGRFGDARSGTREQLPEL